MKKIIALCFFAGLLLTACRQESKVNATFLRCELLSDPLGIDCAAPRLSWELSSDFRDVQQTAYHILVASSIEKLNAGEGDLWDSNSVECGKSIYIPYAGSELKSGMACYWKVKVTTNKGESRWSEPALWSMGLLNAADWKAEWIGLDRAFKDDRLVEKTRLAARYFRKEFEVDKEVAQATLYICGLGLYEAFINGNRIGTQEMSPTATDYSKVVKYNTFDVTEQLTQGSNAIGVTLGNGRFFGMRQHKPDPWQPEMRHFGFPKMIAQLEVSYQDGSTQTLVSDASWKVTADGPIRSNSEFDGEEYDARMDMPGWSVGGFDDSRWLPIEKTKAPEGKLEAQLNRNIQVMETILPVAVTEPKPGIFILDMGQNMVGRLRIKVKGQEGNQVILRFSEILKDDGMLYLDNIRGALVTDKYTLKSNETEVWEPAFTYHGFRFVEIAGFPGTPTVNDFQGRVLYDKMELTGSFETSDTTINQIYKNAYWGIRGNYRSMPTDCPQRDERMGWTGDRAMGSLGESFMFEHHLLYAKWLDDIEQSQREDGSISDVVPNYWQFYFDSMTWPGAYLIIADMLYQQFGNKEPIVKHYASMKKWLDYMAEKYAVDHIMTKDTFGDWCMPPESLELIHSHDTTRITHAHVISTPFYYYLLNLMSKFALISNNPSDAEQFEKEAAAVYTAYNSKYLDKENGYYGNNTVTANILPLRFGMVPAEYEEAVFNNIVEKTMGEFNGHISVGLVGMQQLMRGLSDYGRTDIAFKMATNRTYPSWGYMIENGATTIWELWNGNTANPEMNSGNHVMLLGDLIAWFYQYLAGIQNAEGSVAYKQIRFKPYLTRGLDYVNASFRSMHGVVGSSWKKEGGTFKWDIIIPCNTLAVVYIPAADSNTVTINGKRAASVKEAKFVGMEAGFAIFELKSGNYSVSSVYPDSCY